MTQSPTSSMYYMYIQSIIMLLVHGDKQSVERSFENFRKTCRKALTLSYKRKLCNNNEIFTKVCIVDT